MATNTKTTTTTAATTQTTTTNKQTGRVVALESQGCVQLCQFNAFYDTPPT